MLLERELDIPVNVLNATGGGGVTGHTRGAQAVPDGHTVTIITSDRNTRRAVEASCTPEEIRHTVLLATTTLGFPSMMKTLSWVEDIIGEK